MVTLEPISFYFLFTASPCGAKQEEENVYAATEMNEPVAVSLPLDLKYLRSSRVALLSRDQRGNYAQDEAQDHRARARED